MELKNKESDRDLTVPEAIQVMLYQERMEERERCASLVEQHTCERGCVCAQTIAAEIRSST